MIPIQIQILERNRIITPRLLLSHPQELTDRGARGLEVDYELDLDLEEFEAFQLPKLSASRYLHDFGANMTGIVGRTQFIADMSNLTYSPYQSVSQIQSGASYLSQDFVMFFHASCEGLPRQ